MADVRVAAGQAQACAGDLGGNAATAARLTRQAGQCGADVLVLPEAFLTGYDLDVFAGPLPTPEAHAGPALDPLRAAAAETGVAVLVGTAVDRGDRRTLSTALVSAAGEVTLPYDKQHLDAAERALFTPGENGTSLRVRGAELALSICYDGCFPEHAAAAARDGALAYLNSAAYFPGGEHRRDLYYPARALDNGFYVVFAGLVGECGRSRFIGGTAIYDPEGRPLARLGEEPEGLVVADLDADLVAATRARHSMHHDHRPSLGGRLIV